MVKVNGENRSFSPSHDQSDLSSYRLRHPTFLDGQVEQSLVHPDQPNPQEQLRRKPMKRTHFTTEQKHELNKIFAENCYPTSAMYSRLSRELSIPVYSLKHWFKNRRSRSKGSSTHSHTNPANRHIVISCGDGSAAVVSNKPYYYQAALQFPNHPVYLSIYHSSLRYLAHFCCDQPAWDVTACDEETQYF